MPDELLKVLIDTNVWISAFINPNGLPAKLMEAFLEGRFVPVISEPLLVEIRKVLGRPRIRRHCKLADADLDTILDLVRDRALRHCPPGRCTFAVIPRTTLCWRRPFLAELNAS